MIKPNEPEIPQFQQMDAIKALYCLIDHLGGKVTLTQGVLKQINENSRIKAEYSKELDAFILSCDRKRKRGIIKPKPKRIIQP
jgi:hypothetical protein